MTSMTLLVSVVCALVFLSTAVDAAYPIGSMSLAVVDPLQDKTVYGQLHYPITNETKTEFPVIVFSPGFIFRDTFYDYLWNALVPLGYVMVVAGTYDYDPFSIPIWKARDLAFFLDYVRAQSANNRQSPLYGRVGSMSAAMGHSEGGVASLIAADQALLNNSYSSNFSTVVDLSGCFPPYDEAADVGVKHEKIPILFITGSQDCICTPQKNLDFYDDSISPCRYYANLIDGSHCFFANPGPVDGVLCYDLEVLLGCGFVTKIPKDTQLQRVLALTVPWLQWQLKGVTTARKTFDATLQLYQKQGILNFQSQCPSS